MPPPTTVSITLCPALRQAPGCGPIGSATRSTRPSAPSYSGTRSVSAVEHAQAGLPPVLRFDFETVVDGRKLRRPVNTLARQLLADERVQRARPSSEQLSMIEEIGRTLSVRPRTAYFEVL